MYLILTRRLIDSLPIDPFDAIRAIIAEIRSVLAAVPEPRGDRTYWGIRQYQVCQEASALLTVYLEREGFAIHPPQLIADHSELNELQRKEAVRRFMRFMDTLQTDIEQQKCIARFEQLRQTADTLMGPEIHSTFTNEELACLQESLRRLTDLLAVASELDPAHTKRLIRQLERVRSEFRAITYDLSHFWDFVVEASLVLLSPGKDARELVAEIEKLIAMVWPAQAKALGRPGNTPFALIGCHNRPPPKTPSLPSRDADAPQARASEGPEPHA